VRISLEVAHNRNGGLARFDDPKNYFGDDNRTGGNNRSDNQNDAKRYEQIHFLPNAKSKFKIFTAKVRPDFAP